MRIKRLTGDGRFSGVHFKRLFERTPEHCCLGPAAVAVGGGAGGIPVQIFCFQLSNCFCVNAGKEYTEYIYCS